jgi:hypothetical protein
MNCLCPPWREKRSAIREARKRVGDLGRGWVKNCQKDRDPRIMSGWPLWVKKSFVHRMGYRDFSFWNMLMCKIWLLNNRLCSDSIHFSSCFWRPCIQYNIYICAVSENQDSITMALLITDQGTRVTLRVATSTVGPKVDPHQA